MRLVLLWIVLGAAAAALFSWERSLDTDEVAARDVQHRIGRLIRADERTAIAPADEPESRGAQRFGRTPVSVGTVGEPKFLYRPDAAGVFRCPNVFDTIADESAIDALRKSLLEAEGVVKTRDPARAKEYGFDLPHSIEVSLHGPVVDPDGDQDVRFTVQLGNRSADGKGCYVRRGDDPGVWLIGSDPWGPLALDQNRGRPPLLDPHVIPRIWPGESRRIDRHEVFHADGTSLAITLHDIEISEEEMRKGKSPYEWHLHVGGAEQLANQTSAVMWSSFLFFAPWALLIDPAQTDALGFDDPWARIELTPAMGEPCRLRISQRPLENGMWPVLNENTKGVFGIPTAVRDLLAPRPDVFDEAFEGNPWQPYMQRR